MPITDAISDAIRSHPESVITAMSGIAGTILGGIGVHVLEGLRNRGKVTVMPVEMHWYWEGILRGTMQGVGGPEEATQVNFSFGLRVSNTNPIPKSLALVSVEFHPAQSRFGRTSALLTDPFKLIGTEWKDTGRGDIQLPAHSFTRVYLSGAGVTDETDVTKRTEILKKWRAVRIEFLVSPNKHLVYWHHFTEKDFQPKEPTTPRVMMTS